MTKILSLEDGIREAVVNIETTTKRPVLVAVYGFTDHGKSYLIDRIQKELERKGLKTVGYGGAPDAHNFETIRRFPGNFDVYLYHCAWGRFDSDLYEELQDPNILARNILGRQVNLNILVVNPNFIVHKWADPREQQHLYDLVVLNPNSVRKPTLH